MMTSQVTLVTFLTVIMSINLQLISEKYGLPPSIGNQFRNQSLQRSIFMDIRFVALIDSGAEINVLDQDFALKLGIQKTNN